MVPVIKLKHTFLIRNRWRWTPPRWMRAKGAVSEYLTTNSELTSEAIVRSRGLTASFEAERIPLDRNIHGSLAWVIDSFEKSDWYGVLEKSTKEQDYDPQIKTLRGLPIAKMHITTIKRLHVRAVHDGLIKHGFSRDKANRVIKVLRRILFWAIELDLISTNPAVKMGLRKNAPRRTRWTGNEIRTVINKAIELGEIGVAVATALAYDSSQRPGDLIRIVWTNYNGAEIKVRQSKTKKKLVWIPLRQETLNLINGLDHDSVTIVVDRSGKPYPNRNAFSKAFRHVFEVTGINRPLQFRDIRRTVLSEVLAGGGRSEPLSGHEPGSPAIRVYEVPSLAAAQTAQALRIENTEIENEDETE